MSKTIELQHDEQYIIDTGIIERIESSDEPEYLVVDGETKLVVQSAAAYQRLLDALDRLETIEAIHEAIAEEERGEPGTPAEEVFAEMRKILGIKE